MLEATAGVPQLLSVKYVDDGGINLHSTAGAVPNDV